jgi:hypothetical protein
MGSTLTLGVAVVYLYIAAEHAWLGNYGFAVTFLGFATGNFGMYLVAK